MQQRGTGLLKVGVLSLSLCAIPQLRVGAQPLVISENAWGAKADSSLDSHSSAQQRALKRRQEREARWIEVPEVSKEELREKLFTGEAIVVDVTCQETRSKIKSKIHGARWEDCTKVEEWADSYPRDVLLVFYCA